MKIPFRGKFPPFAELVSLGSNFFLRSILSIVMLSAFLKLCAMDKLWLVLLSFILTFGISFELISITKKKSENYVLSPLLIATIYLAIFFFNTLPALVMVYPEKKILSRLNSFKPLVFALYSIGLMLSVISFTRELLVPQLLLLAMTHIAVSVCSLACALSIKNIIHGKFFYVYPALLVIMNDIFAYLIGKSFGRTPLISLSPNKTVEGLVGGFIFTFITGMVLSFLKIKGLFLSDMMDGKLSEPLNSSRWYLKFPCVYFHNLLFVMAASFFAPFCGFLASAIKRAFGKKDFGALIPGHGGITDRFDCQVLMVFFTYYYLKGVMDFENSTITIAYNYLIDNLKDKEIQKLSEILRRNVH
ncbi:uncharacterized protein VICG_00593 [Vittaforma corneae ATCC 50505]|uniref:Phosphatidate cytidylyltransferase n=1 Tax=Vittaforma corneae (strain ATCC 50505) TaxID=993615 RepID=L2GPE8_VITCO|nr:uncharacterized protein VICG_00593 [Vittaforma corneae ATCC 50505]ELA42494.1 hypothetical protein VICG_00593 [Vittaforma corneae ATCC 50505]